MAGYEGMSARTQICPMQQVDRGPRVKAVGRVQVEARMWQQIIE